MTFEVNTITLKDYGYVNWNLREKAYLVTEYFHGEDLDRFIERNGNFSLEKGLKIALLIASGMKDAHSVDVIHRDLKPANILYPEKQEQLKIIDFGLAVRGEVLAKSAQHIQSSNRSVMNSQ